TAVNVCICPMYRVDSDGKTAIEIDWDCPKASVIKRSGSRNRRDWDAVISTPFILRILLHLYPASEPYRCGAFTGTSREPFAICRKTGLAAPSRFKMRSLPEDRLVPFSLVRILARPSPKRGQSKLQIMTPSFFVYLTGAVTSWVNEWAKIV